MNAKNVLSDGNVNFNWELYNSLSILCIESLDGGEAESLALITHKKLTDTLFCSSDAPAIRALAMIKHSESGISFEMILKKTGLKKTQRRQYTDK